MKKLGVLSAIITAILLTSCSKEVDLGQFPIVESSPIIVEEADANLVGVQNPIILTNNDCKNGHCSMRAQFKNHGSKQALHIDYAFDITSESINGAMSSYDTEVLNQDETGTVDFVIYYSGNVPNEKLGSIKVSYIKNGNGDKATASIEVFKQ